MADEAVSPSPPPPTLSGSDMTRSAAAEEAKPSNATAKTMPEANGSDVADVEDKVGADDTNEDTERGEAPIEEETVEEKPTAIESHDELNEQEFAGGPGASAAVTVPEANGTKKPSSNSSSKRKSSSGVPEHKTKKANKRKSAILTHLDAEPGEYFFARLKGHPPWPAVICDDEMLPQAILNTRPVTAKQLDGNYKEKYADGGSRVKDRTFPIMFLFTNEFAWMPNTDLSDIDLDACADAPEKGKSKSLYAAYQVAAKKYDLQHYKDMLADHQAAMMEDLAESKQAKASKKGKRKSKDATDGEDVDMEDAEEQIEDEDAEGDSVLKSKSKKRKKELDSDEETTKPAKTPKRTDSTKKATKLKLSTPKTPNGTPATKAKSVSTAKSKAKAKTPAKAKDDSEGEMVDTPVLEEKPLSAAEQKAKKEKEVLYLRHKLQKGFLTRDQMPKEEEMKTMSDFVSKLETYADLEVSIIRSTKINKVLKAIIKLSSIPKDEEFNFKARSHELLAKWNKILASEPETLVNGGSAAKDISAVNGEGADPDVEPDASTDAQANGEKDMSQIVSTAKEEAKAEKEIEGKDEEPAIDESIGEAAKADDVEKDAPNIENAPEEEYKPAEDTAAVEGAKEAADDAA
ncbi:MAG: hypothetical protein M1827_004312 [Pycnora praestabilis]|nr:MAG: hypothetical protein M1827_004312 [Pycnora praestabilis]